MKLAIMALACLAATAQATEIGDESERPRVVGALMNLCHNTEVVDVGAAGNRKWKMYTYCPRGHHDPEGSKLKVLDLDECIGNVNGHLKMRKQ